MSFLNSFIIQLLGRKPSFACSVCGKTGGMFLKGGSIDKGQFMVVGKAESGHLILECVDCRRRFYFDPISGREEQFKEGMMGDMLDFFAKQELKEKQSKNNK